MDSSIIVNYSVEMNAVKPKHKQLNDNLGVSFIVLCSLIYHCITKTLELLRFDKTSLIKGTVKNFPT